MTFGTMFATCTVQSNCLDQPTNDEGTTGSAGGTSNEKSKDSHCEEITASAGDALGVTWPPALRLPPLLGETGAEELTM